LDRFLVYDKLVSLGIKYHSWVCNDNISDHMPVILHMELGSDTVIYPFKFNVVWLEDPDFVSLVRTNWAVFLGQRF
jgi:hypothetical protein